VEGFDSKCFWFLDRMFAEKRLDGSNLSMEIGVKKTGFLLRDSTVVF